MSIGKYARTFVRGAVRRGLKGERQRAYRGRGRTARWFSMVATLWNIQRARGPRRHCFCRNVTAATTPSRRDASRRAGPVVRTSVRPSVRPFVRLDRMHYFSSFPWQHRSCARAYDATTDSYYRMHKRRPRYSIPRDILIRIRMRIRPGEIATRKVAAKRELRFDIKYNTQMERANSRDSV